MFYLLKNNGYEHEMFINAAGADGTLIDTDNVFYKLGRNVAIYYNGRPVDMHDEIKVICRSLTNSRAVFCKVAHIFGAILDRPIDKISTTGIPKISSEINKFSDGQNTATTYVIFNQETLVRNMGLLEFPLVYKPANGSHGEGIVLVNDLQEINNIRHNWKMPMMLQEYLDKKFEYRVVLWNKKVINFARKMGVQTKDFKGRRFEYRESLKQDYIDYLTRFAPDGLVGIDLVRTKDGRIVIIESNRAPEFESLDRATGKSTAKLLIEAMNGE